MRAKSAHREGLGVRKKKAPLPEVRAGLVLVRSKDACAGRSRRARRTWLLPILRVLVVAVSMLFLTPTGGMITGMSRVDAWSGGSESEQQEDRAHGAQRQEHIVFVGVPEESAVLPLKALAQEMLARGYRASLALPHGFHAWVEDIPGLSFLSLKPDTATDTDTNTNTNTSNVTTHPNEPPPASPAAGHHRCPARPPGRGSKTGATATAAAACSGKGLGDGWGGGVGGGWGAGLGIWRGLRGSLVGAREFLGHLTAYLGFYRREEAVMYAPLLEALRRDPPALVIADRRASAAFRVCSKLGLRCVVNSAGLLGDLDRPPNSIPAPYTGFPMEGQTIGQRVHSSLFRLVLALSRLQAARDAEHLSTWAEEQPPAFEPGEDQGYDQDQDQDQGQHPQHQRHHHHHRNHDHDHDHDQHRQQDPRSSPVMALGNSCFGSLEYPRELPARVHMVGPLWMSDHQAGNTEANVNELVGSNSHSRGGRRPWNANRASELSSSPLPAGDGEAGAGTSSSASGSGKRKKDRGKRRGGDADGYAGAGATAKAEGGGKGGDKVLRDVWSWLELEPEVVDEGKEAAPVVVVQLGYGGGWAWGVSPEAGVGGSGSEDVENGSARLSWKAFREETVSQLSTAGCRTLWLDHGPHPDPPAPPPHHHQNNPMEGDEEDEDPDRIEENSPELSAARGKSERASPRLRTIEEDTRPGGGGGDDGDGDVARKPRTGGSGSGEDLVNGRSSLMFLDVEEEIGAAGMVGSSEWLLRLMSHRLVTILVTDGDIRSLQTALWHGKPAVVVPTSPDQREAAARLVHSGAGVTCLPPCNATNLTAAVVDAHAIERRRGALRSSAALRETGGVGRAGDLLENEIRTHLAANELRRDCPHGDPSLWEDEDVPSWCWTTPVVDIDLEEPFSFSEGLSWFPDDPEWMWTEMSWLQRHLVDVYAVYGALVMGVGLLMKLTWNLVWSLCDITTAPPRVDLGSTDNPRSPSPSPAKDKDQGLIGASSNGGGGGGGKLARSGSRKWGSGGGGAAGGGGGKHAKAGGKHHGSMNMSGAAVVHDDGTPPVSGGTYSKRMALTNGNHS